MSTIKVNNIVPPNVGEGVSIDGLQMPTAGALSNRNLIINGAMQIQQRSDNITVSQQLDGTTYGPSDRFRLRNHGEQWVGTLSRGTESVNNEFQQYFRVTTTTAETTVDGVNQLNVEQCIEGYNVAHLDYGSSLAKSLTLSFWVRSSQAGTYVVRLYSVDNRLISKVYSIDNANTWELKSFVFDGNTAGATNNNSLENLRLSWQIAAGSGYTSGSTPTTWTTYSNAAWAAGHVQNNVMTTTNATFDLTGVQLEVGSKATPFEHESYGQTLAKCQRYYFKLSNSRFVAGYKRHDSSCNFQIESPVTMRAAPTSTLLVGGTFTNMQSNFSTTQSSPNVYGWDNASLFMFQVASTWSATHEFIPSYEGFTIEFSSEL